MNAFSDEVSGKIASQLRLLTAVSEPVASGDLYMERRGRWQRQTFVLNGIYWSYYNADKQLVGKFDITKCRLRVVSWEECKRREAQFAFVLEGNKRRLLVTAASENNRRRWMRLLTDHIAEFEPVERRFVYANEIILGRGLVQKRVGLVSMHTTKTIILVTNFPRLVVIDPVALVVKEQASWSAEKPAAFEMVSETHCLFVSWLVS